MAHDWSREHLSAEELLHESDLGLSTEKCKTCGCIKITHNAYEITGRRTEYKAPQWTWNPFKTLKSEPPCPAKW